MFLQVIWNNNLKQTSLIVSTTDSYEAYPVIISFPLREDVSTTFVQNFIGSPQFEFSFIEDKFLWLENYHLTKNILAFFNVIDLIELNENHLHMLNVFIHQQQLSTNDFENLGFQSPVKTIARDFKSNPLFLKAFLNIADVSKRLLRTTFSFENKRFLVTVNKREITAQQFFYHLNSDRDRIRIKESLAYNFENKEDFFSYISALNIFTPQNISHNINSDSEELILNDKITEVKELEYHDSKEVIQDDIEVLPEITLTKETTITLNLYGFLSLNTTTELSYTEENDKIKQALENFSEHQENNFNDFFSTERTYEEYSLPENTSYIEEYDNSVFIEQKLEENKSSIIDVDSVEEELTEEFLVEIENNLIKHEQSILDSYNENTEENHDLSESDHELQSVSVDDLVDSINNIIEEPELTLELIDIIDLPIILFLSEHISVIQDNFIDNYFVDSDVNEEINQFSAEEVLSVVNTEVSIFENTVSEKEKKKKSGKHKKEKIYLPNINNTYQEETILDIIQEDNLSPQENLLISIKEELGTIIDEVIIKEEPTLEYSSLIHDNIEDSLLDQKLETLEKIECVNLSILQFLNYAQLKKPLMIHSVELLSIIDFLTYAEIVEDCLTIEHVEPNFNFFEDNKKKLIELCIEGNIELIDELYRNYPEFEKPLINFNYEGDNPVCIASFYENIDLLKKLIDYGWDANYFDRNLNNALIIAAAEGHKHIVRYLLTQNIQINFQNKIGYTALHFAVNDCNHRIVKLLLDAGADVEISDNDRNTALSIAAFKGDINSAKLLLQTRVNVHTKNKKGYDARSIALIAKNHAVAKLIEDKIVSEKHNHSLPPIIEKTFEKNT